MHIVNYDQFLTLPKGTMYQAHYGLEEETTLCIKMDFGAGQAITGAGIIFADGDENRERRVQAMEEAGAKYAADFVTAGKHILNPDARYLIWDAEDIVGLMDKIMTAYKQSVLGK
jgi:hypothetical protein